MIDDDIFDMCSEMYDVYDDISLILFHFEKGVCKCGK